MKRTGGVVGRISAGELEDDAVTTAKIANEAVSSPKIASPGISRLNHGAAADRPTSGTYPGDAYFSTDTGSFAIWDGAAWKYADLA